MTGAEPLDRVAAGRIYAERRWAKVRAERLAAGLPATRREERGLRAPTLDPDVEAYWLDRLDALGLGEGLSSTKRRRRARVLADAAVAEETSRIESGAAAAALTDDDARIAFWAAEHDTFTRRARRDLQLADEHRRQADEAATQLAALLERAGRLS